MVVCDVVVINLGGVFIPQHLSSFDNVRGECLWVAMLASGCLWCGHVSCGFSHFPANYNNCLILYYYGLI